MDKKNDCSIPSAPLELVKAESVTENILPKKSRDIYISTYEKFMKWRASKNSTSFSENVLMTYFVELSKSAKPSTLWSHYSMLKNTLNVHQNINIKNYAKLNAFLKRQSTGFISKKSKVLTSDEIEKFINEAPDDKYLATKAALILGITGACRREELCNITVNDIKNCDLSTILVSLPSTKIKHIKRTFTVTGVFHKILKKYIALRPVNSKSDRFFLNYQNGKCTQQPIGINKFGGMPKEIAMYLNLPDPKSYTGHAFRRTSATLHADARADITTLKRHRGWKSNQVAESYVEDSVSNKRRICEKIKFEFVDIKSSNIPATSTLIPSTSKIINSSQNFNTININVSQLNNEDFEVVSQNCDPLQEYSINNNITFNINNCSNLTFNFDNK